MTPLLARRAAPDRAFESFYRKHVGEVYHYALAVLANPADAEDVVQTTFLNAYRAFQRGERPHKPHNWLIKIAHNVCRMRWRQASRRPQEVPMEKLPELVGPDTTELPDLAEVLDALAALTLNQRAALVMREIEGRTYAEIADVLSLSVPAVEALLFRARRGLKVRRKALGVISAVPIPGSLSSFFGGTGIVAAAGSLLGGTVFKIVAAVTAGMVAAGAGYETVKAVASDQPAAARASRRVPPALLQRSPFASAVARALTVRQVLAAQRQKLAPPQRLLAVHKSHQRRRNAGLAGLLGGTTTRGRDDTVSVPATTSTVTAAVTTVTTVLPAPVKKLIPQPPVPPVPPLPPLPALPKPPLPPPPIK